LDDPSLDKEISRSTGYWTLYDPSLDKEISRSTGYWTLDDPSLDKDHSMIKEVIGYLMTISKILSHH